MLKLNQFHTSIKILLSDNVREYLSTNFQNFITTHGIPHQISCAHTSQQNGIAERKNRHLVDTARTLFIHMHVPVLFLGYRCPCCMLSHKSYVLICIA